MERSIADILSSPNSNWVCAKPGASEQEIRRLKAAAAFELPPAYIELLRYCSSGEGDLAAAPLLFVLDDVEWCIEHNRRWSEDEEFEQFWFFGSNGGLELIAFDLRVRPPYPIVTIDPIAGEDSAKQIAVDMADFIRKIGHSFQDS